MRRRGWPPSLVSLPALTLNPDPDPTPTFTPTPAPAPAPTPYPTPNQGEPPSDGEEPALGGSLGGGRPVVNVDEDMMAMEHALKGEM